MEKQRCEQKITIKWRRQNEKYVYKLLWHYRTTKKEVLIYSERGEGRQRLFPKDDRSKLNLKDMSNYTKQEDLYRGRHSKQSE